MNKSSWIIVPRIGLGIVLGVGLIPGCARWHAPSESQWQSDVTRELSTGIGAVAAAGRGTVEGQAIASPSDLVLFYRLRSYAPAWVEGKSTSKQVPDLIEKIREADKQGLNSAAYHLAELEKLRKAVSDHDGDRDSVALMAHLEELLSDAYLTYGTHLAYGRLNPRSINGDWELALKGPKLPQVLETALQKKQIKESLDALLPPAEGYKLLVDALARYRDLAKAAAWPVIPPGPTVKPGMSDARVPLLRQRLQASGELAGGGDGEVYGANLASSVSLFQRTHGIPPTGALNAATVTALNVPLAARIQELVVNLERFRWLPHHLGDRYVFVDITGFRLTLFEDGKPTFSMPVVVGKDKQPTPVFDSAIGYLVLNPTWTLPRSIIIDELVPKLRRDPSYLNKKGMEVYDTAQGGKREIASTSIDWSRVTESNWHYTISQPPGPKNPLGTIKFMFPNEFSVYLHGSPEARAFRQNVRTESHGCVRLAKPLDLAVAILHDEEPSWDRARFLAAIHDKEEHTVKLRHPIPVHVFYWTAWFDDRHQLNFRPDIYNWDEPIRIALENASAIPRIAE